MKKQFPVLLFILLASINVSADTESAIQPYTLETADKKYIFVMLRSGDRQNTFLRQSDKYPQSGLYLNDGSSNPLWTVDWHGFVILPADGIHMVRRGPWPRQNDGYKVEALSFFANGKLLKNYTVRNLVDFPWLLPYSVSHYRWRQELSANSTYDKVIFRSLEGGEIYEKDQGVIIDNNAGTLKLATLNGEEYVFELKSGRILQAHRPMRNKVALSLIVILAAYLIYLWRASAKSEKLYPQDRWKLVLKPFLAVTLFIIFLIALPSLVELLPEAWARHTSNYEKLGQSLNTLFLTLFYLPYATFRIEGVTGDHQLGYGLLIWPIMFWFVVFFLLSYLNFLLVKAARQMRVRHFSGQADNAAP